MLIKNADDILEHALNFGLKSAAIKYNVEYKTVYNIVKNFAMDTCPDDKCSCEKLFEKQGISMACCLNCDKGINTRIQI